MLLLLIFGSRVPVRLEQGCARVPPSSESESLGAFESECAGGPGGVTCDDIAVGATNGGQFVACKSFGGNVRLP